MYLFRSSDMKLTFPASYGLYRIWVLVKNTRVGVVLHDNSQDAAYISTLSRFSSSDQLEAAVMTLKPAACGFSFCKWDPTKTLTKVGDD